MKRNFSFYFDILTLLVLIAGIVLSRFLMNFGMGMLVFRLIFIGSWEEKWKNISFTAPQAPRTKRLKIAVLKHCRPPI